MGLKDVLMFTVWLKFNMFLSVWPFLPQSLDMILYKAQARPTTGIHIPLSGLLALEMQHPHEHELVSAQQVAEVRNNCGLVQLSGIREHCGS